jgi:glycosyltransferase involved in cell wall biosynthesis
MKIIQIIPQYVPALKFGGPLRVAHNIGKELVKRGHEVVVFTSNMKSEDSYLDVPVNKPVYLDNIKIYYCKVRFLNRWCFTPGMIFFLEKEINNTDFIFSHFHYQFPSILAGYIAIKKNISLIVFPHGSLNKNGINKRKKFIKLLYINFFESKNFRNALTLAFNCKEEKELSLFNENGCVIYNGISTDQFNNLPEKGLFLKKNKYLNKKVIYLFLGRLNYKQKGLNLLIAAFQKLIKTNKNVHLLLVGPDELNSLSKIKNDIKNFNIEKYVTITGSMSDVEKLEVLVDSDVFVLPSPSEGMSIALLEALYMNLPVITTNGVGLNDVIKRKNAGIIVNSNVTELKIALKKMVDKKIRDQMVGNGRKIILENHLWPKIVDEFVDFLNRIL